MSVQDALKRLSDDLSTGPAGLHLTLPGGEPPSEPSGPHVHVRRPREVATHLVRAPGELGFARAFVTGALEVRSPIWDFVAWYTEHGVPTPGARTIAGLAAAVGRSALHDAGPVRGELIPPRPWRRHSQESDAASISHHYDVSDDFYELLLGPTMVYSCAVFADPDTDLDTAQTAKLELICRKLGLSTGQHLLDVGCGWGALVCHAAEHHGVTAVGITISERQAEYASKRVHDAGLADRVEIRLLDYRELAGETYDAISSVGMFEHVGMAQRAEYLERLGSVLAPGGRLLNHQIGRPPAAPGLLPGRSRTKIARNGFVNRFVFPDGELHEVGDLISAIQAAGFEVRHVESLREHYELTLRAWVERLECDWDRAVELAAPERARIWRLYLAGSGHQFGTGDLHIHQILAVKLSPGDGRSTLPLRPDWR